MRIIINEFKGLMPKLSNDKLPGNMAQIAQDYKTSSGSIVPYKRSSSSVLLPGKEYKTLFEYIDNSARNWVYYDGVVFKSRSPIADDVFNRTYFMGQSGLPAIGTVTFSDAITDGETLAIDGVTYEFDIAEDGVTPGNIAVGNSTTTTAGMAVDALLDVAPPAGTTFDRSGPDSVLVTATAHSTDSNLVTFTATGAHISVDGSGTLGGTQLAQNDGEYRAFSNDINSGPWDFTSDYYLPGSPIGVAPTMGIYTGGGVGYFQYFYTFESRYGEEGPGSDLAEIADYQSGRRAVDSITRPDVEDDHLLSAVGVNYPHINVYRTVDTGAGTAEFLRVCSARWFDDATDFAVGDFVFYDDGAGWDLYECTTPHPAGAWNLAHFNQGEAVSTPAGTTNSYLWTRCPADLTNMRLHPNGFLVASKKNVLYFSEPFTPWAWPEDYQITLSDTIVGIGIYGTTIVVATDGNIQILAGPHPDSLYRQKGPYQPCLSQRALVETDLGVMFPSHEGFQLMGSSGAPENVTKDFFSPDNWDDFFLESMHGIFWNQAYYGFFKTAKGQGNVVIDFINGTITSGADYHYATYSEVGTGLLKTVFESNVAAPSVLYISQWDNNSTAYINYKYRSPKYILERPVNFKVAQLVLDTDFYQNILNDLSGGSDIETLNAATWAETDWGYQLGGPLNDFTVNLQDVNGDDLFSLSDLGIQDYVEFKVYVDGVLKFIRNVTDSTTFKLPRGFKDKKWELEVVGMIPLKRIIIATSTEEIAGHTNG